MRSASTCVMMAVAWLAVGAVAALGAYGPLLALRTGSHGRRVWRASADKRISFELPPIWERARGSQEGTRSIGSYDRFVDLGMDGTCTLAITAAGALTDRPPLLIGGLLRLEGASGIEGFGSLRVYSRGRHAVVRWFISKPRASIVDAVATFPAPAWLARRGRHAVIAMQLTRDLERISTQPTPNGFPVLSPTPKQRRNCARLQLQSIAVMRAALTSIVAESGNPYATSTNG